MDKNCNEIIKNFFTYFYIKIDENQNKNNSTVIELLKNNNYFNNLQQVYFFDLVKATGLFNSKDEFKDICNFISLNKPFNSNILLNKFLPFVSFKNYIKTFKTEIQLSNNLLQHLKFQGWKEDKDVKYIITKDIKNGIYGKKFLNEKEMMDILNPKSVFSYISQKEKLEERSKLMAFDIDNTLVNVSNVLLPDVKKKLDNLYQSGYNIVLISNQKRRKIGDPKLTEKLEKIAKQIDLPFIAYCAREEDVYRKPMIGISYLIPEWMGKLEGYVGDAAGRVGDHSDDDKLWAKNMNIPFYVPEEYFNTVPLLKSNQKPPLKDKNLIIMMGYPASGKSTYVNQNLSDFVSVSRDELKTMEKCEKVAEISLKEGKDVVIDNVNFKKDDRERFILLGKKYGYNIIGIHVATGMEKSMEYSKSRPDKKIPPVVFYKLRKEFQEPEMEEGFDKIFKIINL
jgi:bifunctional polynucleotide phosphatase/kinase